MSLYSEYLAERTGDHILELEHGYAVYRFIDKHQVYIVDIYVRPHSRKSGLAALMADSIVEEARAKGCTELLGTVCPSANNASTSIDVLRAYNMTVSRLGDNLIVFRKDI